MVYICDNVHVGNDVFIGMGTVFTNDKHPPSKKLEHTIVNDGASIGANVTVLPGITIGKGSMIGAGSVVTKSVPDGEIWFGNPARFYKKRFK